MSMLAERKRKNKWILLPKRAPDKPIWTTESEGLKFGQKLMEKMGWSAGKGLGANEQGIQEPLRVSYKNDTKGMGYKLNDGEWIEQQEEFNELLNQLSVTTDSKPKETSENSDTQIKSLEEKSKKSKSRVHYQKFTRGKDLSRYSENDLACILGTSKPKNTAKVEPEKSINNEKEETFGVKTIHGGSLVDYFSNKWAEMKKGGKKIIDEKSSNHDVNLSEPNSGDTAPVELDSKKKKAKKRKHSISEENVDINNEYLNVKSQLEEGNNEDPEEIKISVKSDFNKKKAKKSKTSLTDCYSETSEIQNKSKHHLEPDFDQINEVNSISESNSIIEVSLNKKKKKRKNEKIFNENESETVENKSNESAIDCSKPEEVEVESNEGKKIKKEKKKKKKVEEFTQESSMHVVEKIEEDKENKETGRKEKKKKKQSEENIQVNELIPHSQDASVCKGSGMEKINGLPLNENEDVQNSKKNKKDKKQKRNKSESSMTPDDSTKLDQTVENDSEITERNRKYEKPKKNKERKHDERINNDKDEVEQLEEEINLNGVNPEKEDEEEKQEEEKIKTKKKKKKKMKNDESIENEELKNSTEEPEKKSKKKKREKIEEVQIESMNDSNAIEECRLKEKKTKKHKINEAESVDTSNVEPECKNGGKKSESEESVRHPKDQNKNFVIQNGTDDSADVIYTHKAIGLNKKKYPSSTQNMSNDKALKMYCGAEVTQFNGSNLADLEGYGNSLKKKNPIPAR